MTITRIVRSGRVAVLAALAALGCGKGGTGAKPMADAQTPNTIVSPATAAAPPAPPIPPGQDPRPAGEKFAREFLTALNDGKATPAQLTDAFKKVVAPPVLPTDKDRGYSDLVAGDWLRQFAGRVSAAPLTAGALTVDAVVVAGPPPAAAALPIGRTVVRVVKAGAEWKVDWLHQAPPTGTPVPLTGEGDDLAARFAAAAFVETALAKSFDLAETLVAPATRAKLAPSLGGEDAVRGYNRSILRSKLDNFRGPATGYAVAKKDMAGSGATVTGELLAGADRKRPFTLKLTRGPKPGEWLVEDFDPR